MKKLILLASFLAVGLTAYAAEQVYFKIAVDEKEYSTFLTDRISTNRTTLQYLATRMRDVYFDPSELSKEFYDIKVARGMKYFEKNIVQYDVVPKNNDRFRHLIMVDEVEGNVLRKEIYDTKGKLVFSFTHLDKMNHENHPHAVKVNIKDAQADFKGFKKIRDKKMKDGTRHQTFTDGLNRFSIFKRKSDIEIVNKKRILYGNYVVRKKLGDFIYTIVGSIPFDEMDKIIEFQAKLEEKK